MFIATIPGFSTTRKKSTETRRWKYSRELKPADETGSGFQACRLMTVCDIPQMGDPVLGLDKNPGNLWIFFLDLYFQLGNGFFHFSSGNIIVEIQANIEQYVLGAHMHG